MKRLLLSFMFCAAIFVTAGQTFAQDADATVTNPVKHVLILGWDGYGSAFVNWDEVPNLKMMRDNGAWTLKTRCVLPSV